MCTLVILRRPGSQWPLLFAANRDEMLARPTLPPARHWADRPELVGGLDMLAGGSWLGLNDYGLVAAVLNRVGTLGPAEGKRSRGELVLEALDHAEATLAAEALSDLAPDAYRPFNLVVGDARAAYWVRNDGTTVLAREIEPGLAMLTAHDLNDFTSARIRRYKPLFERAAVPDPDRDDWSVWQLLLASRSSETGEPRDAMCIHTDDGYGTRSSSLIALPAEASQRSRWEYADGAPDTTGFAAVDLT